LQAHPTKVRSHGPSVGWAAAADRVILKEQLQPSPADS
jgi:hypothetical protein